MTGVLGNLSVAQSSLQSGLASQQSSLNTSLASVLGQLARYCTVLYCTVLYCAGQAAAQQGVQQPVDPPPGTMLLLLQCTGRGYSYQSVFTITENAPTRAFSWLKVPTSTFTIKKDTIKTLGETGVNPQ